MSRTGRPRTGNTPMHSIRVEDATWDAWGKHAASLGLSRSEWLRRTLDAHVEHAPDLRSDVGCIDVPELANELHNSGHPRSAAIIANAAAIIHHITPSQP